MQKDLEILVLGAMLHDIGKLAQRAKRPYSEQMRGEYLTDYKGKPGHWHTLYTDYAVGNDLPLPLELEDDRSRIAQTSAAHHRPDGGSLAEMTVQIADRLSSGTDRIAVENDEPAASFREQRLVSVFDEVELLQHTFHPPGNHYHALVPLEAGNDAIFPRTGTPKGDPKEYAALWNAFEKELAELPVRSGFLPYLNGLISTLERFTWCVPSATYKTLADVSLFDHSLSAAGIAQALYLYHQLIGTMPAWEDKEDKFILVGGDLSGIQNYIFAISRNSGRGVSKIFRARSFYLQALMRSLVLEIEQRLGLLPVGRLVDSGGKFILLLPNISDMTDKLELLQEEADIWFRDHFKGLLTLNLAFSTRMAQPDFMMGCFQTKIDELNAAIEVAKFRKLHFAMLRDGSVLEGDYEEREDRNCALCDANAADAEAARKYGRDEGLDIPICAVCCEQITNIGKNLPKTHFLAYGPEGKVALFGQTRLTLSAGPPANLEKHLLVEALSDAPGYRRTRMARYLPKITDAELQDPRWFDLFDREKGAFDLKADDPKTFSMIAHKSKKDKDGKLMGRPLLAFFKADVDNLGLIFSLGLETRLSAARFATVSRMLDLFFSDYLVELARKRHPDIYVVFAGGDDLFLVGPWNDILAFSIELRKQLSRFCADNPDITLSGAALTAMPRLPMRKAAEIVEAQLHTAKKQKRSDRVKDAVHFLGETLSWPELEALVEEGKWFDKAIEEGERTQFSTAFLYRLLAYHRMYRAFSREGAVKSGRYLSLAHYDMGRNIDTGRTANRKELDKLRQIFSVGVRERPELEYLNIPLFYAINLNRTTN